MPTIPTLIESERGCGFRKAGGTYLIGGRSSSPCCQLPFPLAPCPCCGHRVKFTRGFQWITTKLFSAAVPTSNDCYSCPLNLEDERIGLMWVGEKYYPTPNHFARESLALGVSKRIGTIPEDCKPGTWVALAHKKAIVEFKTVLNEQGIPEVNVPFYSRGVFMLFKITSIDYVVTGEETEEELQYLEEKGYRLVKIERAGEQQKLEL